METAQDQAPTPSAKRERRKLTVQPLDIIHCDGALLRLDTLSQLSGDSESTLYREAKKGTLRLKRYGERYTRVLAEDARAYLQNRLSGASA